jgi:hypothetical protein
MAGLAPVFQYFFEKMRKWPVPDVMQKSSEPEILNEFSIVDVPLAEQ